MNRRASDPPDSNAAAQRVRRYTIVEKATTICLSIGFVVALGLAAVSVDTRNYLHDTQRQLKCQARLQSDIMAAFADLVSASDADRALAYAQIKASARQLRDVEKVCP